MPSLTVPGAIAAATAGLEGAGVAAAGAGLAETGLAAGLGAGLGGAGLAAEGAGIGSGLGLFGAEATGAGIGVGTGASAGLGGGGFGAGFGAGAAGLSDAFGTAAGSSALESIGTGALKGAAFGGVKSGITGEDPVQGILGGAVTGGIGAGVGDVLGGVGAGAGAGAPPVGSGISLGASAPIDLHDAAAAFNGPGDFAGAVPPGGEFTMGAASAVPVNGVPGVLDPTTPPVPTPTPPTTIDKFIDNRGFGTAWTAAKNNADWLVPGAGLAYAALRGNQEMPGQAQLNATAGRLDAQSQQLQSYLNNGTLPPGVHQSLNQAGAAAKAAIRSRHAASGTSGSSAEQQELAAADTQIQTQGTGIAMQLLQTGVSESNLSAQLYAQIMKSALDQDKLLGSAIGSFAGSLTGARLPGHTTTTTTTRAAI